MARVKRVYEVWIKYHRSGPCKSKTPNGRKSVYTTKREAVRDVKVARRSCGVKSATIKQRSIFS